MRAVVVGLVADELGLCLSVSARQGRYGPEVVKDHYARPAIEYRSTQAPRIVLDIDHVRPIGTVSYLAHCEGSGLWAVAVVDQVERLPDDHRWFSPDTLAYAPEGGALGHDIRLQSLALTDDPGSNAAQRVTVIPGDLAHLVQRDRLRPYPEIVRKLVTAASCNKAGTSVIHGRPTPVIEQRSSALYYSALPLPNVVGRPVPRSTGTALRAAPTRHRYATIDGERVPVHHHGGGKVLSVR